ncbi:hypothetical protein BCR33DRAFT_703616 [Rhizoclosmatium globosum]|uniref:Velvet domain-containing protein n=1 Tax=Rhizoclosmatium globosum TaxID=329046 RepID=A0A1Y2B516_9FUNG|nr:hypothetical protein BCR33DRAFT_703616 [Rhizoclosmatium globosum]|eukprot:ORY29928.1 hypothetical protein BCR33DRAFT_703616 [Rhizoclosmatium globosum]
MMTEDDEVIADMTHTRQHHPAPYELQAHLDTLQPLPIQLPVPSPFNHIHLEIIQQPTRARVSGLEDRRAITPVPILKLMGCTAHESRLLIMHASLWSSDLKHNLTYSFNSGKPYSYIPLDSTSTESISSSNEYRILPSQSYEKTFILMGTLLSECHSLQDPSFNHGLYFIFPDLSVRIKPGKFRLKFDLYSLIPTGQKSSPLRTVISNTFEVFRGTDFPGLEETSALSRCFARQGIPIKMKSIYM